MATHTTLSSLFTAIADAIRAKTGKTDEIVADNFPTEIAAIQTGGGGSLETATVTIGAGVPYGVQIFYVNSSGESATLVVSQETDQTTLSLTVMKNSFMIFTQGVGLSTVYPSLVVGTSGGVSHVNTGMFFVTSSGTIFDDD